MKFQQTLTLDYPPEVAGQYLTDAQALRYVQDHHPEVSAIEVLEDRYEGDTRFVAMRYTTQGSLPGPIKKLVGGAGSPSMVMKFTLNTQDYSGRMEVVPSQLAEKIRIFARITTEEQDGRWVQLMDGEAKVQIFGVGKVLEKFLVEKIQNASQTEFRLRNEYLRKVQDRA